MRLCGAHNNKNNAIYFVCMQEYSQIWVEVNFTVSAYDELKMCKSRTQAIDPAEYLEDPTMNSNLIISKYEVKFKYI